MRIAVLQFSPQVGKVRENIARANDLLRDYAAGDFEVLVCSEMALSGYNFTSFDHIAPYLEPTCAGPTAEWAKATAARLRCVVSVGYPEIDTNSREGELLSVTSAGSGSGNIPLSSSYSPPAHPPLGNSLLSSAAAPLPSSPSSSSSTTSSSHPCYNSTITVSPQGDILAHYRKTHLYYTDETWAQESPTGWLTVPLVLPFPTSNSSSSPSSPSSPPPETQTQTRTTFGICMDLNPHEFTAPWTLYEFATHALTSRAQLLLLSMAWLTTLPSAELRGPLAHLPDNDTWTYWCERLRPLIAQNDRKVVVVVANRCGVEGGGGGWKEGEDGAGGEAGGGKDGVGGGKEEEGDGKQGFGEEEEKEEDDEEEEEERREAKYAGTSWIGELGCGEVSIWDILGRNEEKVLVIDTARQPKWKGRLAS